MLNLLTYTKLAYLYIYIYIDICNLTVRLHRSSVIFCTWHTIYTYIHIYRALALCVEPEGSLCRAPALSVSAPALSVSGPCALGPALSVSGSASAPALSVSGPGSLSLSPAAPCVGHSLALCVGAGAQVMFIRMSPIRSAGRGPQLRSACHPSSPVRSLLPGENPKPYCLGEKEYIHDQHFFKTMNVNTNIGH